MQKTFDKPAMQVVPGTVEEDRAFEDLKTNFLEQYNTVFPNTLAQRTVVVVPSLTLDKEMLKQIKGVIHYEERMLCMLMLLRMPRTNVVYITSVPVADSIIDYYLHMLPGIAGHHARSRLTMLSCHDASNIPLAQKIMTRPRLIARIKAHIPHLSTAHLSCYNITDAEKSLAVQLGIPIYGTDPAKFYEGTKSGSRKTFRESGVCLPDGFEDLYTRADIAHALAVLKRQNPSRQKAVVKMNDGFSGDGNAIYHYANLDSYDLALEAAIDQSFGQYLKPISPNLPLEEFFEKFTQMGGIVEAFVEGMFKASPSVQCIITPNGNVQLVSTHDQVLGGDDGQIFVGAIFPASAEYSTTVAAEALKIAQTMVKKGALGRMAIDFISVKEASEAWVHYAIEINLRKGGTTHPYLMLQFLTDGHYNAETGEYLTASGNKCFYFASDNVVNPCYAGLTPDDLMEIAAFHQLMFSAASQEGVMLHMVGGISQYGKLGMVCIGSSPERARAFFDQTIEILNAECS
ncbi:MAG: carboxylate-amine ligase [Bacteroidetes bacterium]|nr:MAG: carboxylate-amine ligase [Bacteroidota bacterium]